MHKNTIMGQVLAQVRDDKKNKKYFEQIDDLLEDIQNEIYLDINEIQAWNKNGLSISYKKHMLKEEKDPEILESLLLEYCSPHLGIKNVNKKLNNMYKKFSEKL